MDLVQLIFGFAIALLAGTNVWQFFFIRKTRREMESKARLAEENVNLAEENVKKMSFTNYKENIDYLYDKYTSILRDNIDLKTINASLLSKSALLQQKIKEDAYKFDDIERRLSGVQKRIEENAKFYQEIKDRMLFAEDTICLNSDCPNRNPKKGTYKYNAK